jgi:hypothetical protein
VFYAGAAVAVMVAPSEPLVVRPDSTVKDVIALRAEQSVVS